MNLRSRVSKLIGITKVDEKEESYKGKPKFFLPRGGEPCYINDRLGPFIRFFDNERLRNRRSERRLEYLIIGFGAAIPIVNVIGIPSPLSNILSSIFGGIIVVSTSFLQFEKYHERWLISKTTATKLTNEYYYWKNKVGAYDLLPESGPVEDKVNEIEKKRLALLVRNCETILISEASEFVGLFNTKDKGTDVNPRDKANDVNK